MESRGTTGAIGLDRTSSSNTKRVQYGMRDTKGEITLPANTAGTTQEIKFYVIEGDTRYNALFGRPWVHNMRAVSSTLHQALKFPTLGGIKMVYGEQPVTKDMFAIEEVIPVPAITTSKSEGLVEEKGTK
ncbi:PREDICTED: uncharacterized protein LOC109224192 [Nicotiana attenuata]|uniref:uncharacterized protein LOC109224192 n=1 Tax=Nicotiana attenuata TaxID=49451 RepID=UPI0009045E77|nr:PREDICTED: uncharacterized protein LOC109224192 [Nicotiana attenuata]